MKGFYLLALWILFFVAFRCVQNEKVNVEKYDGNVGLYEPPNQIFHIDTNGVITVDTGVSVSEFKVYDNKPERLFLVHRSDTSEYIEISDSSGVLAYWHKDKWEVTNCEKALDVMVSTVSYLQEQINEKQKQWDLNAGGTYVFDTTKYGKIGLRGEPRKIGNEKLYDLSESGLQKLDLSNPSEVYIELKQGNGTITISVKEFIETYIKPKK